MRKVLLSAILLIFVGGMMGCTDSIIPCQELTQDVDCAMDFGWGDSDAADWGGDFGMVCNMDVSPLEECEPMASYLDFLPDFLPIDISIDCTEFEGKDEGWGVCGSSWGWF